MPFPRDTIQQIYTRILSGISSRVFGDSALLRRAILRVLGRVFAGAIHVCFGRIDLVTQNILFVTTATREYLESIHAVMWGVELKPGSFASTTVRFTGVNGTSIPEDTIVQNEEGIEFGTTAIGTISAGIADIGVQAVEAGESGNIEVGVDPIYFQLVQPIDDVEDAVLLLASVTGGTDPEGTESLRARILQRIQYPPMGGSAADYVKWALEVSGVKSAWCHPLAYGPGTVATSIIAEGQDPVPSSVLLGDVAAHIDEVKPVTADSYVESITDISNNPGSAVISYSISITPNTSDFRETIQANLEALAEPHKPGTTFLISQVRGAIWASGISDYNINAMQVNAITYPVDDIAFTGFQYPTVEPIVFSGL